MSFLKSMADWFRSLLFGKTPPAVPVEVPPPVDEDDGPSCSWLDTMDKDSHVGLLVDCGVMTWNVRRRVGCAFWPDLSDTDLCTKARSSRSRVWGAPPDLVGDARLMLKGINFKNANLSGVKFVPHDVLVPVPGNDKDKQKCGADLRGADLVRSNLGGAWLMLCNLERAWLRNADLRLADLRQANFARANLRGANLLDAKLDGANFAWADLTDVIVSPGALRKANLFGAKLSKVNVMGYEPKGLVFGRSLRRQVRFEPLLRST